MHSILKKIEKLDKWKTKEVAGLKNKHTHKKNQTPLTAGEHHLEVISISSETVPYVCQEAIVMERKHREKPEACQITQELGSKSVATGLMKG